MMSDINNISQKIMKIIIIVFSFKSCAFKTKKKKHVFNFSHKHYVFIQPLAIFVLSFYRLLFFFLISYKYRNKSIQKNMNIFIHIILYSVEEVHSFFSYFFILLY